MYPERALATQDTPELADENAPALIGPHAVIHAAEVLQESFGTLACQTVLAHARIDTVPSGECMIPEIEALRLHRWMAMWDPVACFDVAEEAARRTADYIIASRMPAPAVRLLRHLPAQLAAPLLMRAIGRHAWTFAGAGRFTPHGAWDFTIDRSVVDDLVRPPDTLSVWYAAVFTRLYQRMVDERSECSRLSTGSPNPSIFRFGIVRRSARQDFLRRAEPR